MSALDIIQEVRRLPEGEQQKVKRFVRENLEPGQLSAEDLGKLTQRMVETTDPAEAECLKKEIFQGFYGDAGPEV